MDQSLKDQKVDHELCQLCCSRAFGFRGSELCWKSLPKDGGAKLGRLINVSKDYEKLVFTKKLFVEFGESDCFVPYVVYINAFDCFFEGLMFKVNGNYFYIQSFGLNLVASSPSSATSC